MDGLSYLMIRLKVMWKTNEFFWTTFFFNAEECGPHLLFLINKRGRINWNCNYKSIQIKQLLYDKLQNILRLHSLFEAFQNMLTYRLHWRLQIWMTAIIKLGFTFTSGLHVCLYSQSIGTTSLDHSIRHRKFSAKIP